MRDIHIVMLCGRALYNACSEDKVYKRIYDEMVHLVQQFPITEIYNPQTRGMIPSHDSSIFLSGLKNISNNYRKQLVKLLKKQRKDIHRPLYTFKSENEIRNLSTPAETKLNENWNAKYLLIGEGYVGKTTMGKKIAGKDPDEIYPTFFENFTMNAERGNIEMWDTAGQEEYDQLRPFSYPKTDIFFLCYCIVNRESFMNLKRKFSVEARFHEPNAACVLVGCKKDLRTHEYTLQKLEQKNEKPITYEEGMDMANQLKCLSFWETSSRSGEGFDNFLDFFTKLYYSKVEQFSEQKQQSVKKKCFIQ